MDRRKLSVQYWGRLTLAVAALAVLWLLSPQLAQTARAQVNPDVDIAINCDSTATPGESDFECTYTVTNVSTGLLGGAAPLAGPIIVDTGLGGAPNSVANAPSWPPAGPVSAIGDGGSTFVLAEGLAQNQSVDITVEYYFPPNAHYAVGPNGLVANMAVYQTEDPGFGILVSAMAESTINLSTQFEPEAEIELDKILLNNRVAPGGRALFEVTVRNNGHSDVRGLKLVDTVNSNLGNPILPPEAVNGFDLPANSGRTFIVSAKVKNTTSPGDLIRNTVSLDTSSVDSGAFSVPFDIGDDGPAVARGRVGDLLPATDIELVSKSCDPVVPGDAYAFDCEIVIRNNGNADAQGVTVSDQFDDLMAFVDNPPDFDTDQTGLTLDINNELYACGGANGLTCVRRAPMPAGVTDTIYVGFGAPANAHLIANGSPGNNASVTALNPDANYDNNDLKIVLDMEPAARLSILKRALQAQVQPGGTALFEISIRNEGPSDIAGLRLDDVCSGAVASPNPVYISPASFLGDQGLYVPGAGNGTDAAGVITVLASCQASDGAIPGTDTVVNDVSFDLGSLIAGESTLPGNGYQISYGNGSSAQAVMDVGDFFPEADLRITDLTCTEVKPGANGDTTCTVTLTNKGPGSAQNATLALRLRNLIPQNQTVGGSGVTTTQGGVNVGKLWNCSTGFNCTRREPMPDGVVDTITFRFRALPDAHLNAHPGRAVRAEAWLTADSPDPKAGNNFRKQFLDVNPKATVRLEKELLTPNTAPGGTALFAVTLYNDGPADIDGIRIDDQIVTGNGTIVSISPARADANGAGSGLYIPANSSATVLVAVEVDAATAPGDILTNQATVNIDALDAGLSTLDPIAYPSGYLGNLNNTINASASLTIGNYLPEADMDATTTVVPLNNAVAGAVYEFELYVENLGPAPAEGVTVHHILGGIPGDWQVVDDPNATTPDWKCDGQGATCTRTGAMPVGKELVGVFRVLLPPDTVTEGFSFGEGIHQLSVTADNPDPELGNNQIWFPFDIYTESSLSIEKIALENELVAGGDSILFKINVTNDGSSDAYDVEVVDLPGDLTLVSMSSSNVPMDCLGDDCLIPVLPAGETAIIDVVVKAAPDLPPSILAGPYENQALIRDCLNGVFDTCDFPPDPVGAEVDVVGWADLKLQKFVKPDGAIQAGEVFQFTIFVDNLGVSAANNVVVDDTMFSDGKFRLKSVSDDRGACAVATPVVGNKNSPVSFSCSLTSLERYGRWTITAKVIANEEADVNNEARVTADDPQDPDMSNNSDTASMSVKGTADLSVEKVATTPSVNAGETAEWTITVNNAGPSEAKNVQIRDILPAAIVVDTVSISPADLACTIGSPGDPADPTVCNLGNIPSGAAPVVVTISGQVDPAYKTSPEIINDVTVASDTYDPDGGNNRDTANVGVGQTAELSIEKESQPAIAKAGEVVNYAITVSNGGPSTAQNAKVTDALPAEMAYDSAEVVGGSGNECSYAPGPREVTCVLGDLAPSASKQVLIKVTVKPDTQPGDIVNEAALSSDTAATVTDQATTTIVVEVGLSATKRSSSLKPATGEVFYYTVEVTNYGPSVAKDVTVEDELTGSVRYLYSRGAACTKLNASGDDQIECDLGDLAPGQTVTFDIVVEVKDWVKEGHRSDNVILVKSTSPDANGDPAQTTARTEEIVFRNLNDLMIRKFGKPDGKVDAGNKLIYTIIVDNFGPGYAYNTTVRDFLASNGTYSFQAPSFCSPSSGTATGNQQLTCDLDVIKPGEQAIFTVEVTANEAQTVNNTADVSADGTDVDPSNNDAIVEHEIDAVADLRITKAANSSSVAAGDVARFTITVHNDGPSTASNVTVMDMLPGGMTLISADASQGVCSPDPVKCSLGNMSSGATAQITLRAKVDANMAQGETLINSATVTSDVFDNDMSDNIANASVTVGADRRLNVIKEASATGPVKAGTVVEFRITVRNSGKSTVHNVVVKDNLPDNLHFVSYAIVGDLGSCVDTLFDPEVVCSLGSLVPDEERSIYIRAQVDPDAPQGGMTNVIMPDALFDSSSRLAASIQVARAANIRVETQALVSSVRPGDIFAYMVRVINDGPGSAQNVKVDVDLPAVLSYVSDSIGCGPNLTDCSLGDIQPNDQREFQILVKLNENAVNATQVVISATASTSTEDATVDNSQGTAVVPVNGPAGVIYLPLINR